MEFDGTSAMDLAEFQLDHHLQLRRGKMKIKAIVAFMKVSQGTMERTGMKRQPIRLQALMEEE
eukprot:CAMPEP_0194206784 /NCGR_PEP_ID=MMETSP0156-20130528/5726_1 /TAXON_ID=33649 /ORGANISM="Thalassionema nitzschioides, Strain L26-B" /LENGTH=62 /DNA_ID=CAMNT_0038933401 /DNA_START=3 /DNA_END=188 /DNA_ORIENTATION=-